MTNLLFSISVFLAGIFSFFSPCIFPLLPVYLGVLLDTEKEHQVKLLGRSLAVYSLFKTLSFVLGLSLVFILLGYGAGFLGNFFYTSWFPYILGSLVILLGLHQMEIIHFEKLQFQKGVRFQQRKTRNGFLNAFMLGLSFSLGWSPCVGPTLASVLALSVAGGSQGLQGAFLMIIYTLGLSLPFLALSMASNFLMRYFDKIKPYIPLLKKFGGFLIVLMGLVLMFGNINSLSAFFG